ncbi:hypothetical protein SmJEL517_g02057 [Synchytrium microbalum]|uniref:Cyclin N-terminal domain-containing protein n=1 Tax=Synchytrium microbalum TaxID=1806994 RepID=A0A507C7J6_9FUNG|nr:uncharacterized protein SmJEL517_g02057 [Synchytrium microbalum]TPX35471.1 hypothetical protein SmJEL517_g02057 [Synchytrium microbalum]
MLQWHAIDCTKVTAQDENAFPQYGLNAFDVFSSFHRLCKRIHFNINPSTTVILHALEYIKRIRRMAQPKSHTDIKLPPGTESTVFLTALMLANKYADDDRYTVKAWSQASGFAISEINKMERECLIALDYRLVVSPQDLYAWNLTLRKWLEANHPDQAKALTQIYMPTTVFINESVKRRSTSISATVNTTLVRVTAPKQQQQQTAAVVEASTTRPIGLQSPPLGRIDNWARSKPIAIPVGSKHHQSKWWVDDRCQSI